MFFLVYHIFGDLMKLNKNFIIKYKNTKPEELPRLLNMFSLKKEKQYLIQMSEWNEIPGENPLLKIEMLEDLHPLFEYYKFLTGEYGSVDPETRRHVIWILDNLPYIFIEFIEHVLLDVELDSKRSKNLNGILDFSILSDVKELSKKIRIKDEKRIPKSLDLYDVILSSKPDGFYIKDALIDEIISSLTDEGYDKSKRSAEACVERRKFVYYVDTNIYSFIRYNLTEQQKHEISMFIKCELENFPMISAKKLGQAMNEIAPLTGINWEEHDNLIHDYLKKQIGTENKDFDFKRKPIIASSEYRTKVIEDAQTDLITRAIEICQTNDVEVVTEFLQSIGLKIEYIRNMYSLTRKYEKVRNRLERL